MKRDGDELTERQVMFVSEYAKDLNATQAAIRAGYSRKMAHVRGCLLLQDPRVQARVGKLVDNALNKNKVTVEWIVEQYVEVIARSKANMGDFVNPDGTLKPFDQLTKAQTAAIAEYIVDETGGGSGDGEKKRVQRTRIKLHSLCNALDALEALGRYLKMFKDEPTGPNGAPIQVEGKLIVEFVTPQNGKTGSVPREITVPILPA